MNRLEYERALIDAFFRRREAGEIDFHQTQARVAQSTAVYKGAPVPYLHLPIGYTREDASAFERAVDTMQRIGSKTIEAYMRDPEVRELYDFDPRLDALIRLPKQFPVDIPMGRFDVFYNGPDAYAFCELNTDGSSAMNEADVIDGIIGQTLPVDQVSEDASLEYFELFHSWVAAVKHIYSDYLSWGGRPTQDGAPLVAIVDFVDRGTTVEFERFKETFEADGLPCEIVDPREIQCRDGCMYAGDRVIDIVYRRLVTRDLMERYAEIPDFIEGLKAGKTCVIGGIRTQIVHTKRFFEMLHHPVVRRHFTEAECAYIDAHVPFTQLLTEDAEVFKRALSDKDAYIIKPVDFYASKGVCAGSDYTAAEWQTLLEERLGGDFVVQRYCEEALINNLMEREDGEIVVQPYKTITGMYAYNGRFAGLYVRAGRHAVISGLHQGLTVSAGILK